MANFLLNDALGGLGNALCSSMQVSGQFRSAQEQNALQAQAIDRPNQDYARQGQRERAERSRSGMMYMGQEWPRQPIPVYCDGWKSDTLSLERHGYTFMVEYDASRICYRIAIGKAGARSMIMIEDFKYDRFLSSGRPLEFHGEFITSMEVNYTKSEQELPVFVQKDMNDAYWCEHEALRDMRRIDVRELFPQSQTAPESQIVLPDAKTVTEVLDLLLEKQSPRREEVRGQQKERERKVATILQLEEETA